MGRSGWPAHALDEEARAWELLEPWDVGLENATMIRQAGYRFHARWATCCHSGRVFLAGDAAHQTPPFAGQRHVRGSPGCSAPGLEARPCPPAPGGQSSSGHL